MLARALHVSSTSAKRQKGGALKKHSALCERVKIFRTEIEQSVIPRSLKKRSPMIERLYFISISTPLIAAFVLKF